MYRSGQWSFPWMKTRGSSRTASIVTRKTIVRYLVKLRMFLLKYSQISFFNLQTRNLVSNAITSGATRARKPRRIKKIQASRLTFLKNIKFKHFIDYIIAMLRHFTMHCSILICISRFTFAIITYSPVVA